MLLMAFNCLSLMADDAPGVELLFHGDFTPGFRCIHVGRLWRRTGAKSSWPEMHFFVLRAKLDNSWWLLIDTSAHLWTRHYFLKKYIVYWPAQPFNWRFVSLHIIKQLQGARRRKKQTGSKWINESSAVVAYPCGNACAPNWRGKTK